MTFKSIFAWIAKLFTHTSNEETKMSDDLIQSGVATATVLIAADVPATPVVPAVGVVESLPPVAGPTELEKLEELIEKLELTTVKEVKAAIGFIRALV